MNISILDSSDLSQKTIISSWTAFGFLRSLNSKGEFSLTINANSKQAKLIEEEQIVYVSSTMCGLIKKVGINSRQNTADEDMTISGIELKDITAARVTRPASGVESFQYTSKTVGHIVYNLLDKLFVGVINPDNLIPYVRLDDFTAIGDTRDFSTRLKPLNTEIYNELLEPSALGIECRLDTTQKLVYFNLFEGVDRTKDQSVNPRAIFEINKGTLDSCITNFDS